MKLNKRYISIYRLFQLLNQPEFTPQGGTHEAIRRRAHRGLYGKPTVILTGGQRNHYLVDLTEVKKRVFPVMSDEMFEKTINKEIQPID